jgi:hypothetical protein
MSRGVGRYEQLKAENQNIVFILSSKPSAKLWSDNVDLWSDNVAKYNRSNMYSRNVSTVKNESMRFTSQFTLFQS